MTEPTITILFRLNEISPDARQFKPSGPGILTPSLILNVMIEVPLRREYLWNAEEIIQKQLNNDVAYSPILTPKGYKYVIDQFENEMSDKPETKEWNMKPEEPISEDDWDK